MNALNFTILDRSSKDEATLHAEKKAAGFKYTYSSGDNYSLVSTHKLPADLMAAAMNHAKHTYAKDKMRVRLKNKLAIKNAK